MHYKVSLSESYDLKTVKKFYIFKGDGQNFQPNKNFEITNFLLFILWLFARLFIFFLKSFFWLTWIFRQILYKYLHICIFCCRNDVLMRIVFRLFVCLYFFFLFLCQKLVVVVDFLALWLCNWNQSKLDNNVMNYF